MILPILALVPGAPALAADPPARTTLANFGGPIHTAPGGWFHVTGGSPTVVRDRLVECGAPQRWAWRIDVLEGAAAEGVGAVIPLYDDLGERKPVPLDLGAHAVLELECLGEVRGRTARIVVHGGPDAGAPVVRVIAPDELDARSWRRLQMDLGAVGVRRIADVRVLLEGEGPSWIALARLDVTQSTAPVGHSTESSPASNPVSSATPAPPVRRALWIWNTDDVLRERAEIEALLRFCHERHITDLFWKAAYAFDGGAVALEQPVALRRVMVRAHDAGLRVHALDGAPQYALPENHARMLALLDALERFNAAGDAAERFDGLHLDNEPYLLPGWKDGSARQAIIDAFVVLNRTLGQRAGAAGLEFGLDLPFWFDGRDADGAPRFPVALPGGPQPLTDALFACVQNVGIMSYRERVTGRNGAVALCRREFELGRRHGVVVFASLEVGTGPRVEPGVTLGVYPPEYVESQIDTMWRALAFEPGCGGLALHHYHGFHALDRQRR